jgi:hypothetical protein
VQALQTKHDLNCEFPDCFFLDRFAHQAFYVLAQVAFRTVFHDDVQFGGFDERIRVLNNEWRVDFFHEFGFVHGPLAQTCIEPAEFDLLDNEELVGFFVFDSVDNAERAGAEFGENLIVFEGHWNVIKF